MKLPRRWTAAVLGCWGTLALWGCSQQQPADESARTPTETAAASERERAETAEEGPPIPRAQNAQDEKQTADNTGTASPTGATPSSVASGPVAQVYAKSDAQQSPRPSPLPAATSPAKMPPVVMTEGHAALCPVRVGDAFPDIALKDLEGTSHRLRDLYAEKLTVVCFWSGKQVLARAELADLTPDVVVRFADRGVAVAGIAEEGSADQARHWATDAKVAFPILLDPTGDAWAKVGGRKLPRTYLLDQQGTILWFDIEYSRATRRELQQAIRAALGT